MNFSGRRWLREEFVKLDVNGARHIHRLEESQICTLSLISAEHRSMASSVRCQRSLGSWEGEFSQIPTTRPSDKKWTVEKLWRQFFSDPSQWWDHRLDKKNERYPDFKHKKTQEALWLNGRLNPQWVKSDMAALTPGTIPRNPHLWNAMLAQYVKDRQDEKAVDLFHQMRQKGINSDRYTFVPLLKACARLQAIELGRFIHADTIQIGCESDVFVAASLIDMYTKCQKIEEAWKVFNNLPTRDLFVWNAMIMGCTHCGLWQNVLELYLQMQGNGVEPDPVTFVAVLNTCGRQGALEEGKHVHAQIIKHGYETDAFVGSSLVEMYAKCGSLENARQTFSKLTRPATVAWNSMMIGYTKVGLGQKALELFYQMQQQRVEPNAATFVRALNACTSLQALEQGKCIHFQILQSGSSSDIFVGTSLVDMYAKCGCVDKAREVFNKMPTRNVVAWNAMIMGYVKCGQARKGLEVFQQMQEEGIKADPATFVGVINACASLAAIEEGRRQHANTIQSGCDSDLFVLNSLVNMYAKCGSIEDARTVFNKMPVRDLVAWNAMIQGCVRCGHGHEALELFERMQAEQVKPDAVTFVGVLNACTSLRALEKGRLVHAQVIENSFKSDVFVCNCLIDLYAKCGSIEDSWRVFNEVPVKDVVAWNTMIQGYVRCGQGQKALELSWQMQSEGVEPNSVTLVAVLNACASVAALEEGRRIHAQIMSSGCEPDMFLSNSLIDMYVKCGSIDDARSVFNNLPACNVETWNAILGGYAIHGHAIEALRLFEHMREVDVPPDMVSFVCLMSAFSHAGFVEEGLNYFESMGPVYGVRAIVDHYTCVVDLLGRAGRLHEAEVMVKSKSCQPNATVWMSLLGACRVHGNVEMGEQISKQVMNLDPTNTSVYTLLSNIYSAAC